MVQICWLQSKHTNAETLQHCKKIFVLVATNTHLKKFSGCAVLAFIIFKQPSNTVPRCPLAIFSPMCPDRSVSQVNRLSGKLPLQFGSYVQNMASTLVKVAGWFLSTYSWPKWVFFLILLAIKVVVRKRTFGCVVLRKSHLSVCKIFVCFCAACHRFCIFAVIRTNRSVYKSYSIKMDECNFYLKKSLSKPYWLKRLNVVAY